MEKINEILRGKIPHYLAVAAFLYAFVGVGGSLLGIITGAEQKERERIEKYVNETVVDAVDRSFIERFPKITGKVTSNGTNP